MIRLGYILLILFLWLLPASAELVLTEFVADNQTGLVDEDGDYSDWIEIYNPGPTATNLLNYRLTEDLAELDQWVFPSRTIGVGEYLVVYASNKNRKPTAPAPLHTNFRISAAGGTLALVAPNGSLLTTYTFPKQDRDISYGKGTSGTFSQQDLTPSVLLPGVHYHRVSITGAGTAVTDQSLNLFDDGLTTPGHQQYLWYDYAERLDEIAPGDTVLSATLEWEGHAPIFAGVSNLGSTPASIGIFPCPDANQGIDTLATGNADQLVAYYAANTPTAQQLSTPDTSQQFQWNLTGLVKHWQDNPGAAQRGHFLILNSAQPHWVAWNQHQRGPTLHVLATSDPSPLEGFMSPTPAAINAGTTPAGPLIEEVVDNIPVPPANQDLLLTARLTAFQGGPVTNATLHFRRMYLAEQTAPLRDDGQGGDAVANDQVYTAVIPAAEVHAGEMLRWSFNVRDTNGYTSRYPTFLFPTDSPEYLGTVPTDPTINSNLDVLHTFIENPAASENRTGTRASLYFLGEFYDNVYINLHGQSTAGPLFIKKSANINFNRKHRFRWDPSGEPPRLKKVNLLSNYADKTKMRHILAYEIFREAGSPAHFCVPLRVERNGAFQGTYDLVEDGDDRYLERAGLNPDGALYKMYNNMTALHHAEAGAEKKNREDEDNADLAAFLVGLNQTDLAARRLFLYDHVDLPAMVNFMAANTTTANVDLHAKNYYIYRDSGKTDEWQLLPWDLDLSLGRLWLQPNAYFDDGLYPEIAILSGRGQSLVRKLQDIPEIREMLRRRMRSLHDTFIQENSTPHNKRWLENRFSELSLLFGNDALLDYNLYQPTPPWKEPVTGLDSPLKDYTIAQELDRLRTVSPPDDPSDYLYLRRNFYYDEANTVAAQDTNALPALVFASLEAAPASGDQDQEYIQIMNTNSVAVDISYWSLDGAVDFDFHPGTVIPAMSSLYVSPNVAAFRARNFSPTAGEGIFVTGPYQGHLSNLGETLDLLNAQGTQQATTNYPANPSDWQRHLVITEFLYQPSGDGLAEYIELQNISTNTPLDLNGVAFTLGVDFSFTGSAVTNLAPGEQVLVVRDLAAFETMFGPGLPVAGVFTNTTALNNGGETLKLEDPQRNTITEFEYDNQEPWPTLPISGYSLVLMSPTLDPLTHPLNDATRWRASAAPGGTPGGAGDATVMSQPPLANNDGDASVYLLEYFFGTSDFDDTHPLPSFTLRSHPGPMLTLELTRDPTADDATWSIELANDLDPSDWTSHPGWTLQSETREVDGRSRQIWQLSDPTAMGDIKYARLRVSLRE